MTESERLEVYNRLLAERRLLRMQYLELSYEERQRHPGEEIKLRMAVINEEIKNYEKE